MASNFIKDRYDLVIVGVGAVALAAAATIAVLGFLQPSPDEAADATSSRLSSGSRSSGKVAPNDMVPYGNAVRSVKTPPSMSAVDPKKANFLASERRVLCSAPGCGKPIDPDAKVCPFCNGAQEIAKPVSLDNDNDGLPNEWEIAHGLNPNDPSDANKDSDGDGFTNLEEYKLGFDMKDPKSHPDYLEYLSLAGKPETTKLQFYFKDVNPLPGNKHRFTFMDLVKKDRFTKRPIVYSVREEEEIVDESGKHKTGYSVVSYEKKQAEKVIKGSGGLKKMVDVDTVVIRNTATKKELKLVIGEKVTPVDVQAKLHFDRGNMEDFSVVPGDTFKLYNVKYHVISIDEKDSSLVVEADLGGKRKVIR